MVSPGEGTVPSLGCVQKDLPGSVAEVLQRGPQHGWALLTTQSDRVWEVAGGLSGLSLTPSSGWFSPPPETTHRPWSPLTFSPPQLTVAEGDTATFTCSFSHVSESFVLNWYRMSPSNQTDKLAAFPEDSTVVHRDRRFQVTRLPNKRDFKMSVHTAQRNDSGIYLCGAIYLLPKMQIYESPHAELVVTGAGVRPESRGEAEGRGEAEDG